MGSQAVGITISKDEVSEARNEIDVEREIAETVNDMRNLGLHKNPELLREIAMAEHEPILSALAGTRIMAARYWAQSQEHREAAAKLLAEEGLWDPDIAAVYAETGYQHFMENDPFLMCINRNYAGGPFDFGQINTYALREFIQAASIGTLCRLDLAFYQRLSFGSQFCLENPELVEEIADMLLERADFVSRGMSQLPETTRRGLKGVIERAEKRRQERFHA